MGGKSRKAGGVSRKLIAHIKQGKMPDTRPKKTTTNEKEERTPLFDKG
jgi:hypothetical protein